MRTEYKRMNKYFILKVKQIFLFNVIFGLSFLF